MQYGNLTMGDGRQNELPFRTGRAPLWKGLDWRFLGTLRKDACCPAQGRAPALGSGGVSVLQGTAAPLTLGGC